MPTLETDRIVLRPFEIYDAEAVQMLAGDWEVANKIPAIPYPYPEGAAQSWINYLKEAERNGTEIGFAIVRKNDNTLMGSISLIVSKEHKKASIAYWLGKPYWGNGYATEACKRIVEYGFKDLNLNRLYAWVMTRNSSSCRVLEKVGLKYEGCSPQSILSHGIFEDIYFYGLLKSDYI